MSEDQKKLSEALGELADRLDESHECLRSLPRRSPYACDECGQVWAVRDRSWTRIGEAPLRTLATQAAALEAALAESEKRCAKYENDCGEAMAEVHRLEAALASRDRVAGEGDLAQAMFDLADDLDMEGIVNAGHSTRLRELALRTISYIPDPRLRLG